MTQDVEVEDTSEEVNDESIYFITILDRSCKVRKLTDAQLGLVGLIAKRIARLKDTGSALRDFGTVFEIIEAQFADPDDVSWLEEQIAARKLTASELTVRVFEAGYSEDDIDGVKKANKKRVTRR